MIVVDANILFYLVLQGPHTSEAEAVSRKDRDWRAPRLWRSEMLNGLAGYVRRGDLSVQLAAEVLKKAQFAIKAEVAVRDVSVLALVAQSRCSSYDCEYVAAAETLGVQLVTADKQVLNSFRGLAVTMADFLNS
jgi:predicted nucleic acid-binding protein